MGLRVVDPYSGEPVGEFAFDAGAGLDRKLAAARDAARSWGRVPVAERARRVGEAIAWFERHREAVARDITRQIGKPIVQSRREVDGMLARARHAIAIAAETLAPELLPDADGTTRRIEHAPRGVVLDIAAWNYPLLIAVNVVVPALLAGNAVLLKHSPRTPLCGLAFERAFATLGAGLVTHLVLTHDDTARLAADPRVDHVVFTGSVEAGRRILAAASSRIVDVGLELGGNDPAYVAADADLAHAAENVVDGACYNAGQSCCAVERVYVHRDVAGEFVTRAQAVLERYRLGDPSDEATTLGPLASRDAIAGLQRKVDDARARGARVLLGGRPSDCGRFFLPTLLADCPHEALVMREESFGPLVPVAVVASDDEAIARMNDSPLGLTASVWTRDRARAERFVAELEAGTVYQNRCDCLDPALPWSGWKDSGKGVTLSHHGLLALTRSKSVMLRG